MGAGIIPHPPPRGVRSPPGRADLGPGGGRGGGLKAPRLASQPAAPSDSRPGGGRRRGPRTHTHTHTQRAPMSPGQGQGAEFSQALAQQLLFTFLASLGDQEPAPALRRQPPPPASLPPGRAHTHSHTHAHTHPPGPAAAAAAIKHPGTCSGSRRALAGRLMSNCSSAGVALKGPARAGRRGCAGRPRDREGRGCRATRHLYVPQNREPADGKEKGGEGALGSLIVAIRVLLVHLSFEIVFPFCSVGNYSVFWGSAGSKPQLPSSGGDQKPPCSEQPANVWWKAFFPFSACKKEFFLSFFCEIDFHPLLAPNV